VLQAAHEFRGALPHWPRREDSDAPDIWRRKFAKLEKAMRTTREGQRDEFFESQQRHLRERLAEQNIPTVLIEQVIASGYFSWGIRELGSGEGRPAVMDSYYGNKIAGLIEVDEFVEYLRSGTAKRLRSGVAAYKVKSVGEALSILGEPQHARFAPRMTFRGQTADFHIRRAIPNPRAAGEDGRERMIVPSWWRPWIRPPVTKTEYLVRDISLFKNIPPLRPIRQFCGLPAFHFHEIAAAARDLHAIFYLDDLFDSSGLPVAASLFPHREEDRFYGALLELKQRVPSIWGEIVEYEAP
jgi:hypothetical protein